MVQTASGRTAYWWGRHLALRYQPKCHVHVLLLVALLESLESVSTITIEHTHSQYCSQVQRSQVGEFWSRNPTREAVGLYSYFPED